MAGGAYATRGSEFIVNTKRTGVQTDSTMVALAGGGFIISWTDTTADGSGSGVKAQIYGANGTAIGSEFLVNTTTLNAQDQSSVAALSSGGFVVTWTDNSATGPDVDKTSIRAQLFDAGGARVGGEFLVNTTTRLGQSNSAVTSLASGGFVVSWVDASATAPDANGTGVRAQIYSATGARIGGEFLVNNTIAGSQQFPVLTGLASGGFVATWVDSSGQGGDASAPSIKAQVFSATGAKLGTEFLVNTAVASTQDQPVITALDGGGFVIVWRDLSQQGDTSSSGIKAQLYSSMGVRIGSEFLVNATTYNSQDQPSVTSIIGGGFAISWRDNSNLSVDTSGFGIKTQIFDSLGNRLGGEFQVNGITTGNQEMPTIIALQSGALVVSWTDYSGTGGDTDGSIKARILDPANPIISDVVISNSDISETAVENTTVASLTANGALNAVYTYQIIDDSTGAFAIQGNKLVVEDSLALDYEVTPGVTLTVRATDSFGNIFDKIIVLSLTDSANERRYEGGTEAVANTTIAGAQQQGAITALANGQYVMTWTDGSAQGADTSGNGIKGQIVDAYGTKIGSEFQINATTVNGQDSPAVAALASGGFVVTWTDNSLLGGDASGSSIKGQIFNAAGSAIGAEFLVNTTTTSVQKTPSVVALSAGGFVVTWADSSLLNGDDSGFGVRAQMYDANGNRINGEFLVNSFTAQTQDTPVVAALSSGGFVISWHDTSLQGGDANKDAVKAQIYNAAGARVGGEFLVNTVTAGNQQQQAITGLATGGFAIAWADASLQGGDTDYYAIKVQVFDAAGTKLGPEILANTTTLGGQIAPTLTALAGGGFMVGWADYSGAATEAGTAGIKGQIFADDGARIGAEFVVNTQSLGQQVDPAVAAGPSGGFAMMWTDYSGTGGDDLGTSIKFRSFAPLPGQGAPPPLIANPDTVAATEDQSSVFLASSLLANDFDANGALFSLTSVSAVSGGTVTLNQDRDVIFTPFANFSGAALFTYVITDTGGATSTGRVTVNVAGVNDAPVAFDDQLNVSEDGATFAVGSLLGNDVDVDPGDVLTLQALPLTTLNGIAISLANGSVTYAPGAAYQSLRSGQTVTDSFGYTISDSSGLQSNATVTLTIIGANDAPNGFVLSGNRVDENAVAGTVVGNLSAVDVDQGDVLSYSLSNNAGGRFVVNPLTGIVSVASGALLDFETATSHAITARVTDSGGLFVESSFTIGVNNLPEPKTYTGDNGANSFTAPTNDLWTINGLGGNDILTGNASADVIFGGTGADIIDGSGGADMMYGGVGADTFYVDNIGDRVIEAFGEGIDLVFASVDFIMEANVENLTQTGTGDIAATGNDFSNTINGNAGNNIMYGGPGGDLLVGAAGNDILYGEAGNDFLQGGIGDDTLVGGAGIDELTGGAGLDRFVFNSLTVSADRDTVKDFTPGDDVFVLSRAIFTGLSSIPFGSLPASAFVAGPAATNADQRIIYNKVTGALFYDADGSGSEAAIQIAMLGNRPTLTEAHFVIG